MFAGGVAGALLRTAIAQTWGHGAGAWPWATFTVNLAGAFLLGLVVTRRLRPALLGHGFCGALTTFSTMQVEVLDMIDADRLALAAAYVAASAAAGVAAVRVATTLARRW